MVNNVVTAVPNSRLPFRKLAVSPQPPPASYYVPSPTTSKLLEKIAMTYQSYYTIRLATVILYNQTGDSHTIQ